MNRRFLDVVVILAGYLIAIPVTIAAQTAPDPRAKLSFFVGKWTVQGSESTSLETCEWLSRDSFVVCRGEDKAPGSTSASLGMIGYSPEEQVYTVANFSSSGRSRNLRGWLDGETWVFTGQRERGTQSTRWKVTITPTAKGFHFRQEVSINGSPWSTDFEAQKLRIL